MNHTYAERVMGRRAHRSRLVVAMVGCALAVTALSACGSGGSSTATGSTTTSSTTILLGGSESTSTTPERCRPDEHALPDGTWSGPIALATAGTGTGASGAVYSQGAGNLDIVIENGVVTGGVWTMAAQSEGTIRKRGATASTTARVSIDDGVPTGSRRTIALTGTAVTAGEIVVSSQGSTAHTPLNGSQATRTALTLVHADCDEAEGTLLPDWNGKTNGKASVTGTFVWRGHRS